jgi:hypothetical protein
MVATNLQVGQTPIVIKSGIVDVFFKARGGAI